MPNVLTVNGSSEIGGSSSDTLTITSRVSGNVTFTPDVNHIITTAANTTDVGPNIRAIIIRGPGGAGTSLAAAGDIWFEGGAAASGTNGVGGDVILKGGAGDGSGVRGGIDVGYNATSEILFGGSIDNPGTGATIKFCGELTRAILFQSGAADTDARVTATSQGGTGVRVSVWGGDSSSGKGGTGQVRGGNGATAGGDCDVFGGNGNTTYGGSVNIEPGLGCSGYSNGAINIGTVRSSNYGVLIGKSTNPIGFFGSSGTAQPSSTGQVNGFTAGSGTAANDDSTYTGGVGTKAYTVGDLVKHFKNLGLLASS